MIPFDKDTHGSLSACMRTSGLALSLVLCSCHGRAIGHCCPSMSCLVLVTISKMLDVSHAEEWLPSVGSEGRTLRHSRARGCLDPSVRVQPAPALPDPNAGTDAYASTRQLKVAQRVTRLASVLRAGQTFIVGHRRFVSGHRVTIAPFQPLHSLSDCTYADRVTMSAD